MMKGVRRRLTAALAASGVFSAAAPVWSAECKLVKLADLPVTMTGLQPRVSAKINGADVVFLADTGAFYSTIPPANAAELHLSTYAAPFNFYVTGIGGDASATVTRVDKLALAGSIIPRIEFVVAGSGVGAGTAGLLGQNVLGLADGEYDLGHGVIRLLKPQGCARSGLAYWAENGAYAETRLLQPLEDRGRFGALTPSPRAEAFLNGHKIRVMLDTGAATSVISLDAARRAGVTPSTPGVTPSGGTFGIGRRIERSWIALFSSFKIGSEEIKNAKIRIADVNLGDVDMLLGADFFLAHRVLVANSQWKIYFTYNGGPVFNILGEAKPHADPKPALVADEGDADTLARLGEAALSRRDVERAVSDLLRAHLLAPLDPRYDYQLGRAQLAANEPVLAAADFDEAVRLKPDFVEPRLARAQMRLARRDGAGALDDLDSVSATLSNEADLRLILANAYDQAEKFQKAVSQFDLWIKAHSADARLASAYIGRCWAKVQMGADLEGALSDCNRASRMAGASSDLLLSTRGLIRLRLHDDAGAIKDYDAAVALNPKNAWALYGRSVAERRLGLAKADEDLQAALALMPRLAQIWKRRALTP